MALFPQQRGMMSPSMPQGSTRKLMGLPSQPAPDLITKIKSGIEGMFNPVGAQRRRNVEAVPFAASQPSAPVTYSSQPKLTDQELIDSARMFDGAPLSAEMQQKYGRNERGLTQEEVDRQRFRERGPILPVSEDPATGQMQKYEEFARSQAARGAMSPQGVVTPEFRVPLQSPASGAVNPYGPEYLNRQLDIGSSQVARQYGQTREDLRARLAGSGISPDSPLFQSMLAKLSSEEAAARGAEIDRRQQFAAQQGANFEMERTRLDTDWKKYLQDVALQLDLQPAKRATLEAQAQNQNIRNILDNLGVEEKRRTIDAAVDQAIADARLKGIEVDAAEAVFAKNNPDAWYNSPLWPFLGPVLGAIIGGAAFGPAGILGGAQAGAVATGLIGGQDAESIGNLIERSGLMSPRTQGPRMSPQGETSLDVTRRGRMTQPANIPIQRAPYPGYGGQLPRTRF